MLSEAEDVSVSSLLVDFPELCNQYVVMIMLHAYSICIRVLSFSLL